MHKLHRRVRPGLLALLLSGLLSAPFLAFAQGGIVYVYDDLNRLIAVVDQQGNSATYLYDSVGNLLRIERFDVANIPAAVGITLVSPDRGKVATTVQIFGKGFSAVPSQNAVAFNGTPAMVTAASPNRIETSVPAGATTGSITVTTPLGTATSPSPFTVVGTLAIDPTAITLRVTGTQQFLATEDGAAAPVRWSVNDIPGGDPAIGTISTDGLYTAPPRTPPGGLTVTVTATHTDDPTVSALAMVTIPEPQPAFIAAQGVSVRLAEQAVDHNVATSVGVAVQEPGLRPVVAPGVGIQRFGGEAVTALAPQVSTAHEPIVTSLSPSMGPRDTADLPVTITGSGLGETTSVSFLLNNVPDTNIAVTVVAVAPDGTQLDVQVSISSTAALGPRVVQTTTPAAVSTTAGTGGNVFTVQ